MLMSFPVDATPDTLDIIADIVDTNSSVIDGRRFAKEFVARRKLEAAPSGNAAKSFGAAGTQGKAQLDTGFTTVQPKGSRRHA